MSLTRCRRFRLFRRLQPVTWQIHFEDDAVVNQPINGGCCRERILEDALPFREREIARQHDAPSLVTFRQESEKDFHFVAALLLETAIEKGTTSAVGRVPIGNRKGNHLTDA